MNKLSAYAAAILAVACLSSVAFADPPPPGSPPPPPAAGAPNPPPPAPPPGHGPSPEMLQKIKTRMLNNQQQRIQILQQGASCIQAATAMDQLRDCHEKEHQALKQMEEQMKQQRQQDRK